MKGVVDVVGCCCWSCLFADALSFWIIVCYLKIVCRFCCWVGRVSVVVITAVIFVTVAVFNVDAVSACHCFCKEIINSPTRIISQISLLKTPFSTTLHIVSLTWIWLYKNTFLHQVSRSDWNFLLLLCFIIQ